MMASKLKALALEHWCDLLPKPVQWTKGHVLGNLMRMLQGFQEYALVGFVNHVMKHATSTSSSRVMIDTWAGV